jgi:hypothetical protein
MSKLTDSGLKDLIDTGMLHLNNPHRYPSMFHMEHLLWALNDLYDYRNNPEVVTAKKWTGLEENKMRFDLVKAALPVCIKGNLPDTAAQDAIAYADAVLAKFKEQS